MGAYCALVLASLERLDAPGKKVIVVLPAAAGTWPPMTRQVAAPAGDDR